MDNSFPALLKRELLQALHDPRRLLFLFGAALAYLIVFGMLYTPNVVKEIPCVIYDADQTYLSHSLIEDFESSDSYKITVYADSEESMRNALRNKEAFVAIEIPKDFAKNARSGKFSTVLFMVNGSNIIMTNVTSGAAQNIINDFSNKIAAHNAALLLGSSEKTIINRINPVTVNQRVLGNPTQGYMLFFLLGLAMVADRQP